jgi:hypothetical protein
MVDDDFESFTSMLDSVSGLISRGKYIPSADHAAIFFATLRAYPLAVVSQAFTDHVRDPERGKFAPTPADVIAKIEAAMINSRPGPEEAWAMIPAGEDDTIVWTAEMAEAHAACAPLLAQGDHIAARMTFKEVYAKAVTRAVSAGVPVQWQTSLGWDLEKRKRALTAAVEAGRLPPPVARDECPALPLTTPERLSLPAPVPGRRESFRQTLNALIDAKRDHEPSDPKAWARDLKRRDEAGEELSIEVREAYKRALHYAVDEGELFSGFAPIPDNLLPPGMRQQRPEPPDEEQAIADALAWEAKS